LAWWKDHLGDLALTGIRPALIGEYRDILHAELAGGTVNRYLAALSAVMTACVRDWLWLIIGPCPAGCLRAGAECTGSQTTSARGAITLTETKNEDRRTLPLTGHALELLQQRVKKEGLVFAGPSGKPLAVRTAWQTATRRAGLEDFRFHALKMNWNKPSSSL
jgi:hypothetical protein